jgi:single-strand DNA-binding protein
MARGFNKVILMGNLTRDPEMRYTADRRACAKFAVAVNNTWKDKSGEKQESVDFINIVVFGPMAESCEKYLGKGRPVLVEGRLHNSSYEAKDGSGKRYSTDVIASGVTFLGSKSENSDRSGSSGPDAQYEDFPMDMSSVRDDSDSDIPF